MTTLNEKLTWLENRLETTIFTLTQLSTALSSYDIVTLIDNCCLVVTSGSRTTLYTIVRNCDCQARNKIKSDNEADNEPEKSWEEFNVSHEDHGSGSSLPRCVIYTEAVHGKRDT